MATVHCDESAPVLSPALQSLVGHIPLEVLVQSSLAEAQAMEARVMPRDAEWIAGLFVRTREEARAIPEVKVRAVDTDVPLFSSSVIQHSSKIAGLRPIFAYLNHPVAPIDRIEEHAIAASDANATHAPREAHSPSPDLAVLEASGPMLELCKQEGSILVLRGYVDASEFAGLALRRSFLNNAVALMRYARVLEQAWEHLVEMKSTLTKEDIATFIAVAAQLSEIVAERAEESKVEEKPADMSARTYTLFAMSYDEIDASLAYIFRHTPEWIDEYLPRKPKKPVAAKAKKTSPGEEKAANDQTPAPVKTSNGHIPAPTREEVRATE